MKIREKLEIIGIPKERVLSAHMQVIQALSAMYLITNQRSLETANLCAEWSQDTQDKVSLLIAELFLERIKKSNGE